MKRGAVAAGVVAAVLLGGTLLLVATRTQANAPRSIVLTPGRWTFTAEVEPAPPSDQLPTFLEAFQVGNGGVVTRSEVRAGVLRFEYDQNVIRQSVLTLPTALDFGTEHAARITGARRAGQVA